MKNLVFIAFLVLNIGCQTSTTKEQLESIIDTYHAHKKTKDNDFPLGDYRESKFKNNAAFCDSLLTELKQIDTLSFDEEDKISYTLLKFVLNETVVNYQFKTHWNPILSDAGFHSSLTYQVRPITSKGAALNYLKKMKAIPNYIEQQTQLFYKYPSRKKSS